MINLFLEVLVIVNGRSLGASRQCRCRRRRRRGRGQLATRREFLLQPVAYLLPEILVIVDDSGGVTGGAAGAGAAVGAGAAARGGVGGSAKMIEFQVATALRNRLR